MKIHLATDHAGFTHKNAVASWLRSEGIAVVDHGATALDPDDDFPDFIVKAAHAVAKAPTTDRAIIFGGSGQGEAMLANRFPGVRATVLYSDNAEILELGRAHNDSNILSIGARFLSIDDTKKHIWSWLNIVGPTDKKYLRRDKKIDQLTRNLHT